MKGVTAYKLVRFLNFFGLKYGVVVVCRNNGSLKTHSIAKIKSDNLIEVDGKPCYVTEQDFNKGRVIVENLELNNFNLSNPRIKEEYRNSFKNVFERGFK